MFRVWALQGLGFRVQGLGFRVSGFRVQTLQGLVGLGQLGRAVWGHRLLWCFWAGPQAIPW